MIEIKPLPGESWLVTVTASGTTTEHRVHVGRADAKRYGGASSIEKLLEASFRFLLDREPNTAILGAFDLPVINRYFPEYEHQIQRYLAKLK